MLRLLRLQELDVNIRNYKCVLFYLLPCEGGEAASSSGKVAAGSQEEGEEDMPDDLLALGLRNLCGAQVMPVCSGEEEVMTPAADDGDGASGEEQLCSGEEAGGDDADVDHYAWIPPDYEDVVAGGELGECCKEEVAEEDPYQ